MQAILLEKGRVFRIALGPSIRKGDWYYGFLCHDCKKPILVFEDRSKGTFIPVLVGEGKFSVPCQHCPCDTLYGGNELRGFQADFALPSFRDSRPAPSGSPRQPLLPKYKGAKVTMGIGALEHRPEAALVIARIVTYWTSVEATTATLLATIMKANTEPAVAVYLSLQNNRAKRDVMYAAAEATLQPHDFRLFEAVMNYRQSVERERNAIAHGIFGISPQIKDGLIWIDTASYITHQALAELTNITEEFEEKARRKFFVYQLGDLETVARDIENLDTQIAFLWGYLSADDPAFRATRYPQLCAEPRVKRELDLLDQKNAPPAPPK